MNPYRTPDTERPRGLVYDYSRYVARTERSGLAGRPITIALLILGLIGVLAEVGNVAVFVLVLVAVIVSEVRDALLARAAAPSSADMTTEIEPPRDLASGLEKKESA